MKTRNKKKGLRRKLKSFSPNSGEDQRKRSSPQFVTTLGKKFVGSFSPGWLFFLWSSSAQLLMGRRLNLDGWTLNLDGGTLTLDGGLSTGLPPDSAHFSAQIPKGGGGGHDSTLRTILTYLCIPGPPPPQIRLCNQHDFFLLSAFVISNSCRLLMNSVRFYCMTAQARH